MTSVPELDASILTVGGNCMYGVPFPIVIGDRYIHLRKDGSELVCQVWRWDPVTRTTVREPDPGDRGAGVILQPIGAAGLELRLASEVGEGLTGSASLGDLRVAANEDGIEVFRDGALMMSMQGSGISGSPVGVRVDERGVGIGSSLPEGFTYQVDYAFRRVRLSAMVPSPEMPVIENARFSHCRIEGPVLIAGTDVTLQRNRWHLLGSPQECVQIDLPNPNYAYGAVILRNVGIYDSEMVNVAFATPQ